jgi:lysophospholipid acyltransferase (LPLAT)-like uncharacterized protein
LSINIKKTILAIAILSSLPTLALADTASQNINGTVNTIDLFQVGIPYGNDTITLSSDVAAATSTHWCTKNSP